MNRREEEQLIKLTKIMTVLLIVLIIVEMARCSTQAKAAVITGETHLAGIPVYLDQLEVPVYPLGIELLAQVMYHENYCNGETMMYYTGAVVMNRVHSKKFPNSIRGVLYQDNPKQYGTTHKFFTEKIPYNVYQLAIRVAKGTPDVPENVIYQAMFPQGFGTWKAIPSSYSKKDIEYFCFE